MLISFKENLHFHVNKYDFFDNLIFIFNHLKALTLLTFIAFLGFTQKQYSLYLSSSPLLAVQCAAA